MAESGVEVSSLIGRRPLWRSGRLLASTVLIGGIVGLGYWGFIRDNKPATVATTQAVKVTMGPLSTTLTASGTAAAEHSTPLTFSTGGLVTQVMVRLGEEIKAGQPLVRLDARDATRKVESAQASLVQAQLRLKQLLEPSAVDRTAMQQSLLNARQALENAQATYTTLGRPTDADLIAAQNTVAAAKASYQSSLNSVETSKASLYQAQNTYCSLQHETTVGICTPDKLPIPADLIVVLQTSIARNTAVPTQSLISAVNSLLSANASHVNALANKETAAASVVAAEARLKELTTPTPDAIRIASNAVQAAQAAYDSTKAKADALATPAELDLLTQQQAVRTAEIALQTAQDALDDTTLVAPFSGKAGAVAAVVGQRIGSGASAVVLSNPDAIRLDLTISEADLVNIKAGMLGLARFDSMPRNAYVVKVIGVSTIPTVTQGVVTYPVQAAILRGNALNDIRDQLPSLTRSLTSGAAGAQFGAILGGGAGGARAGAGAPGASGAQGARLQGASGASGATGGSGAQGPRPQGASGASGATGASGPRGASGAAGASGAGGPGGGGLSALLNPPLPAAGMNASITLLVSVTENQLLLPTGAVRRQGNQQFVYQPNPTAGGAPVQKPVTTAGTDGTNIAIASGLAEGDTVLLGAIGTATPAASKTGTIGGAAGGPGGGGPGGVGGIR